MLSTVYVSRSSYPFTDDDLANLLLTSRSNNARLGITGMLLHREGRFIQVLEGPDEAVRARLAVIARDPRHTAVHTIVDERVEDAGGLGRRAERCLVPQQLLESRPQFVAADLSRIERDGQEAAVHRVAQRMIGGRGRVHHAARPSRPEHPMRASTSRAGFANASGILLPLVSFLSRINGLKHL